MSEIFFFKQFDSLAAAFAEERYKPEGKNKFIYIIHDSLDVKLIYDKFK